MPIRDGFDAIFSGNQTEKESASHIAQECDQHSANDEIDPPLPAHSINLAQEKRNHQRCRKGWIFIEKESHTILSRVFSLLLASA